MGSRVPVKCKCPDCGAEFVTEELSEFDIKQLLDGDLEILCKECSIAASEDVKNKDPKDPTTWIHDPKGKYI